MIWRGILELNRTVEAETEEEAQRLLTASIEPDDWIVWEDHARSS